jgi:hypothetical protein
LKENFGPLLSQARKVLAGVHLIDSSNEELTRHRIKELINHSLGAAFDRAVNNYNPNHSSGARFSTYLVAQAKNEMQKHIPHLLGDHEKRRALALRDHTRLTGQIADLQSTIDAGKGTEQHRKQLQAAQEQRQLLEGAYSLVPRGEKIGEGQQLRRPAERWGMEEGEQVVQPTTKLGRQSLREGAAKVRGEVAPPSIRYETPEAKLSAKQEAQRAMTKPLDERTMEDYNAILEAEGLGELEDEYKSFSTLMTAAEILRKADDAPEPESPPAMKYLWREGEPGAHKYMWEDPKGNVVRGTNAPVGHPHHDETAGPAQIHEHEPTPGKAPHMFDHFGRKLHRPAPEGVETEDNANYDPDANHWSQKYENPETGGEEFISLHRDRVKNHRYSHNEDLRHLDAQLEKVRQWYDQMFQAEDMRTKAIGLAMALIDQAKMIADGEGSGLLSMRVGDVSVHGNGFKFSYKDSTGDKHVVSAVLDSSSAAVLQALSQGKKSGDLLFDVEGNPVTQQELAQVLDQQFGLSLKQFRVYHGSELFSKEFQRITSTHSDLSPDDLHKIADQACARVMRMMGHKKVDPETAKKLYIDPIVIEALFMSAIHHHDEEINKSISELLKGYKLHGRCIFQGLPVSIENRKGSKRSWFDPHNQQSGTTHMKHAYGYIRGTKGTDGDHVDVYLGPDKNSENVFVVHQRKAPDFKEFDEDKCMLGFPDGKAAKDAYMAQYDKPGFFGGMTSMPMEEFKEKVLATKKRPQMIKAGEKKMCSACKSAWGMCKCSKAIEKAFAGSADTGPVVWHVTVTHPERTPDEQMFGDWIHSHPMHEHDQHWSAFKQATKIEDLPDPEHGREYAHGGDEADEDEMDLLEEEHPPVPTQPAPEGEEEDLEGGEPPEEEEPQEAAEAAKSLLAEMIQLAI